MTGNAELLAATDTAVEISPEEGINFVIITNPLTPLESRQVTTRQWDERPLSEHLPELVGDWAISTSHHGNIEEQSHDDIYLRPGEFVVMAPIVHGGNSGKTILRLVALVAISYLSWGIGTGATGLSTVAGSAGIGAGISTAALAAAGTAVGGSLLVNALLPPATLQQDDNSKATYGYDGPKTTARQGIAIPVVAGEHWISGNAVSTFVDNVGDDQQYLNMLLNLGEGRFSSFEDIRINEQPIENFSNVAVDFRAGTENQSVIPWFNDVYTPVNRNIKLPSQTGGLGRDQSEAYMQNYLKTGTPGSDVLVHTTTGPADSVRLDFTLPAGQARNQDEGIDSLVIDMWVGYREAGTNDDFVPLGELYVAQPASAYTQVDIGGGEMNYVTSSSIYPEEYSPSSFNAVFPKKKTSSPVRRSFVTGELDNTKRYEFRMTNAMDDFTSGGKVKANAVIYLADVNEVLRDDIRYKHSAMLGLRILMNDQLSSIPNVTVKVRGLVCDYYNGSTGQMDTAWSDNPAWIAYTCLTNDRFGGGIDPSRIKLDQFKEWASFCFLSGLKFNGVIPNSSNIIDALKPVFRAGRAAPVRIGTKIGISMEKARTMSAMFGSGNIFKGSMKINWSSINDRANQVQVHYYDETNYNKKKTIVIENEAARLRGDAVRTTEIDARGITNLDQASKEGRFAMNMNALTRSVSFDAPLDAITMTLGEVFGVSHDMPNWGTSGRLLAGSTQTTINLDRPVTMESGKSYQFMVRHDSAVLVGCVVQQVLGYAIYLSNYNPNNAAHQNASRLSVGGIDYEIIEPLGLSNGYYGVLLGEATPIAVSDPANVVAIDYIETQSVVLSVGDSETITLASPLRRNPEIYSNFAFGEVDNVVSQYTCRAISGDGDQKRTITGLEYNPDVFDDVVVNIPVTTQPGGDVIENVNFLGFTATIFKYETTYRYRVVARWDSDDEGYDKAEVWVSFNGEAFVYQGDYKSDYTIIAEFQDVIDVQLVPINRWGKKPFRDTVDIHNFVVDLNEGRTLTAPLNVTASPQGNSIYIDWTPSTLDEDDVVVADADRPAVFKIYAESLGLVVDAPDDGMGGIDWAALSAIPWTPGGFPTAAITMATYFNYSGLAADSIYRIWVQEIHPFYPDVVSDVAPDTTGLFAVTTTGQGFDDLFPEGIREIHFSTELAEKLEYDYNTRLNELAAQATQTDVDLAGTDATVLAHEQEITTLQAASVSTDGTVSAMSSLLTAIDVRVTETENGIDTQAIQITGLESNITDLQGDTLGNATAIDGLNTTVTNMNGQISAISSNYTSLSTTVGNQTSTVSTLSASVNGIYGEYTVLIDAGERVAGIQLINGANQLSNFSVMADVFKIHSPTDPDKQIFAVDSRDGATYIDKAVARIMEYNYTPGVSGFQIDGYSGNCEFNDAIIRGTIQADTLKANTIMVGTEHLEANSVTVPVSVFGGNYTLSNTVGAWLNTVQTPFVNVGANVPVLLQVSFEVTKTGGSGESLFRYRLIRDIQQIYLCNSAQGSRVYNNESEVVSFVIRDTPGAGDHVYTLAVTRGDSGSATMRVQNASILCLGAKK